MKEKFRDEEEKDILCEKLKWEVPKLYSLNKDKTEGGTSPATPESTSGTQS